MWLKLPQGAVMDENCAANNTHFKSSHKRKVFVLDPLHLFKVTQTSLSSIVTLSINVIQGLKFPIHFQQLHPPLKFALWPKEIHSIFLESYHCT